MDAGFVRIVTGACLVAFCKTTSQAGKYFDFICR